MVYTGSSVNASGYLCIEAVEKYRGTVLSGSLGIAGTAGIGTAIAVMKLESEVTSDIRPGTVLKCGGEVNINAQAGKADSTGSFISVLNTMGHQKDANEALKNAQKKLADGKAEGEDYSDNALLLISVTGTGGGVAGVGISGAVLISYSNAKATISGKIDAKNSTVYVRASSGSGNVTTVTLAAGVAGAVSVDAAVAVIYLDNLVLIAKNDSSNLAEFNRNTETLNTGNLKVYAWTDEVSVKAVGGAGSIGAVNAGVYYVLAENTLRNTSKAYLASDFSLDGTLEVLADADYLTEASASVYQCGGISISIVYSQAYTALKNSAVLTANNNTAASCKKPYAIAVKAQAGMSKGITNADTGNAGTLSVSLLSISAILAKAHSAVENSAEAYLQQIFAGQLDVIAHSSSEADSNVKKVSLSLASEAVIYSEATANDSGLAKVASILPDQLSQIVISGPVTIENSMNIKTNGKSMSPLTANLFNVNYGSLKSKIGDTSATQTVARVGENTRLYGNGIKINVRLTTDARASLNDGYTVSVLNFSHSEVPAEQDTYELIEIGKKAWLSSSDKLDITADSYGENRANISGNEIGILISADKKFASSNIKQELKILIDNNAELFAQKHVLITAAGSVYVYNETGGGNYGLFSGGTIKSEVNLNRDVLVQVNRGVKIKSNTSSVNIESHGGERDSIYNYATGSGDGLLHISSTNAQTHLTNFSLVRLNGESGERIKVYAPGDRIYLVSAASSDYSTTVADTYATIGGITVLSSTARTDVNLHPTVNVSYSDLSAAYSVQPSATVVYLTAIVKSHSWTNAGGWVSVTANGDVYYKATPIVWIHNDSNIYANSLWITSNMNQNRRNYDGYKANGIVDVNAYGGCAVGGYVGAFGHFYSSGVPQLWVDYSNVYTEYRWFDSYWPQFDRYWTSARGNANIAILVDRTLYAFFGWRSSDASLSENYNGAISSYGTNYYGRRYADLGSAAGSGVIPAASTSTSGSGTFGSGSSSAWNQGGSTSGTTDGDLHNVSNDNYKGNNSQFGNLLPIGLIILAVAVLFFLFFIIWKRKRKEEEESLEDDVNHLSGRF